MPVLRRLICEMAVLFALSGTASAECRALAQAVNLTERNFAQGGVSDPAELAQLNGLISGISNDQLLSVLRSGGRANAFGDLRNFLTQLKFISAATDRSAFRFTPQMQEDLSFAREIVDRICSGAMDQPGETLTATGQADQRDEDRFVGFQAWLGKQRIFGSGNGTVLQVDGRWQMLAPLVLLVLVAAALVIAGHYIVQLLRLMRRRRRICSIPAELVCMMTSMPGHVTVLELSGCTFTPTPGRAADEMRDVSAGTYCSIWIDAVELHARLTSKISEEVEMAFSAPISAHTLTSFLDQSEAPVRFDFSTLRDRSPAATAR